jgi:hypothetical protein
MSVEMFDYMDEILNLQSASKCFLFVVNVFKTTVAELPIEDGFLVLVYVKCSVLVGYLKVLSVSKTM